MNLITLVNDEYLPGLFALLQSLKENAQLPTNIKFYIISESPLYEPVITGLKKIGIPLEFLSRVDFGDIQPQIPQQSKHHNYAYKKLLIFQAPLSGPLCFIDTDMICLNPLTGLEQIEHFSAAPDIGSSLVPQSIQGRPMFNTGLMVFNPSISLYGEIYTYLERSTDRKQFIKLGDQVPLNYFFYDMRPDEVHLLDPSWNTLKRLYRSAPNQFDLHSIRLLHFVGTKPWDSHATPDTLHYYKLNQLWGGYYQRSGGQEVLSPLVKPVRKWDLAMQVILANGRIVKRILSSVSNRIKY